jgi:hypothetical protein
MGNGGRMLEETPLVYAFRAEGVCATPHLVEFAFEQTGWLAGRSIGP